MILVLLMNKMAVIGVGNLGSCIAYEIANRGLVDEIVLLDVRNDLAEGNSLDISQAMVFRNKVKVFAGDFDDVRNSKIIVLTAGKPRTSKIISRVELVETNTKIVASIVSNLSRVEGTPILITLTNPVDIMNYMVWKKSGWDRKRVLGSAGMLDSARLRTVIGRHLGVSSFHIEAFVIGEHGDLQVPLFSHTKINGKLREFSKKEKDLISDDIRKSALDVISKKGSTIYAPANNTVNMIESILTGNKKVNICSAVLNGEYGLKDISIGVPVILGVHGIEKIVELPLSKNERSLFYRGADNVKKVIESI